MKKTLPSSDLTRTNLVAVINRAKEFAPLAETEDERAILNAGLMPKTILAAHFGAYPKKLVEQLIEYKYVTETESLLIPNPRRRTRPIVTRYDIEKPRPAYKRSPMTYNVFGRDRLLLWYAAANSDFTGSRGEGNGLCAVLDFFRLPKVQKLWRRYLKNPNWRIPEDAA
jgi:hypothetical protein